MVVIDVSPPARHRPAELGRNCGRRRR
jgi:hypothetical protein